MRRLTALGAAVVLLSTGCSSPDHAIPLGFSRASADRQRSLEQRLIERADAARVRDVHRELTRLASPSRIEPRPRAGRLDCAAVHRGRTRGRADHDARSAAAAAARGQRRDDAAARLARGDAGRCRWRPGATSPSPREMLPYHAFSASGEVNAPVVYAGPGTPADYEWLARRGIDVKGRIVLVHSTGAYRYRGLAAFTAQQFGAAAVLMFTVRRRRLPALRARLDPTRPRWPASNAAASSTTSSIRAIRRRPDGRQSRVHRRLPRSESRTLPRIISAPISAVDARMILSTLEGPAAPEWWGRDAARATSDRVRRRFGSVCKSTTRSGRSGR